MLENYKMNEPILFNFSDMGVEAFGDHLGKEISIYKTTKKENIESYNKHSEELKKVSI